MCFGNRTQRTSNPPFSGVFPPDHRFYPPDHGLLTAIHGHHLPKPWVITKIHGTVSAIHGVVSAIHGYVLPKPWGGFADLGGGFGNPWGGFACLMGYFRQSRRMDCFSLRGRCHSGMMRRRHENSYRHFLLLLLLCRLRVGDH